MLNRLKPIPLDSGVLRIEIKPKSIQTDDGWFDTFDNAEREKEEV